ncbi:MAG: RagB/SusD family nutrient uptake outer membrane protein, partial [Bacteroidales bacterium]|nr:RagB/SusD family nutrient uptake outer membrane protein [Bacteroidales bacterium]
MKLNKYIFILLLIPALSCDPWLELVPPNGLVQDEYWKTKEDVEATLMGAYQLFNLMDEKLFLYGEIRADMISRDNNTPNYINSIIEGNIYPDNKLCDWSEFYIIINYCNNVLKYNPIVFEIDNTYSEFQMKGIESEALFLRSLAYFYLVRIFKEVPFVTDPSESDDVEF